MSYILSQILGFAVVLLVIATLQTRNMKLALLIQVGINVLGMISYVLLGGFAGCGISLVGLLQSVIYFVLRKKDMEEPKWLHPSVLAAYVACSLITFQSWLDLLPMMAALLFAVGVMQKKSSRYRIALLFNGVVWLVYDLTVGAYTMLASHSVTILSAVVGILRLDLGKKDEQVCSVATEQDIPFISEVYEENLAALHGVSRTPAQWKELLSNGNSIYYIVRRGVPVAWFRVEWEEDTLWLGMLQVKPACQRQGIGRYILTVVERMAKEEGLPQVGIHTTEDNAAARALYTAQGYEVTEIGPCTTADGVDRTGYTFRKKQL